MNLIVCKLYNSIDAQVHKAERGASQTIMFFKSTSKSFQISLWLYSAQLKVTYNPRESLMLRMNNISLHPICCNLKLGKN